MEQHEPRFSLSFFSSKILSVLMKTTAIRDIETLFDDVTAEKEGEDNGYDKLIILINLTLLL